MHLQCLCDRRVVDLTDDNDDDKPPNDKPWSTQLEKRGENPG